MPLIKYIRRVRTFFSKPKRISQTGSSRFYFYNHGSSGPGSINRFSPLFERSIRMHLRLPINPASEVADRILHDLKRDGIVIFPISQVASGDKLLDALYCEWTSLDKNSAAEIDERRRHALSGDSAKGKPYLYEYPTRCAATSPHWQFAIHPDILYVVNSYMNAYARVYDVTYLVNFPMRDKSAIRSQVWHRDGDGTVLKLFVYLSDVTEETGPFVYAAGTHCSPLREVSYGKTRPQTDDELRALLGGYDRDFISAVGKKGTVVLTNTSGIHKGGHVLEGERRVLRISYYPSWIDRSDYGLKVPKDFGDDLHPAQQHALSRS
jgi:hypothetical protein